MAPSMPGAPMLVLDLRAFFQSTLRPSNAAKHRGALHNIGSMVRCLFQLLVPCQGCALAALGLGAGTLLGFSVFTLGLHSARYLNFRKAATCSHSQPLAATRVAASGRKWPLCRVAASDRKWPPSTRGRGVSIS